MKHILMKIVLPLTGLFCAYSSPAQLFETAAQYMDHIGKVNEETTVKYLVYLSAVSHGKSARKVEKRRVEVVNSISDSRYAVMGMPPWKGDKSYRDSAAGYLKMLYNVFNEDYGKIVNMEEIAEQSYDGMEAYLLAQEKAQEKLSEAHDRLREAQKQFAAKNNINLLINETEIDRKAKIVNEVMGHCNEVYLVFFKCYKQEAYLMDAISKKNLVSIEQSVSSLKKFADEGDSKLKKMKGHNGDNSLIAAGMKMMDYYRSVVARGQVITDYFLKEEEFNKIKKQFESKPNSKRTQQDIDQYNKAVNDINAALGKFNSSMTEMNKQGVSALNDWNKTYNKYMDEHMPKQQRN